MGAREILKDIFWVGAVDWDLRNFHGYLTQRGSSYNAYLIMDEKKVLVDTVKEPFREKMIKHIAEVIDPSQIDIVVSNHVEMDHSGSLARILEVCRNATLITSPNGEKGLKRHYKKDWNFRVVSGQEKINIGKRDLVFALAQMVHWPDSMVTYIPQDRVLLSNDAFGQHIASEERFDDEYDIGIIREEAAKYYANIVLPYGNQVRKLLDAASGLDIDMIAPSHGIIWRKNVPEIVSLYAKWSDNGTDEKAVIVYDTMWKTTEKMAYAIKDAFAAKGKAVVMRNLQVNHISDIITDVLSAKYICVGSPTLNNGMLPTVAAFLTYLKGLAPKARVGMAFGSYGWGGQSVSQIETLFEEMGWEVPVKNLKVQYVPDAREIKEITEKIKTNIN